jgi:hypothetical protein
MQWTHVRDVFVKVKTTTDTDKAAQLIMSRCKDQAELRATYRSAPDLFDNMTHPRLNMLMFNLL